MPRDYRRRAQAEAGWAAAQQEWARRDRLAGGTAGAIAEFPLSGAPARRSPAYTPRPGARRGWPYFETSQPVAELRRELAALEAQDKADADRAAQRRYEPPMSNAELAVVARRAAARDLANKPAWLIAAVALDRTATFSGAVGMVLGMGVSDRTRASALERLTELLEHE